MPQVTPGAVVESARSYLGTPFAHAQRSKGVGVDCVGLVICVARDLGIIPACFDVLDYPRAPDRSALLRGCVEALGEPSREDPETEGLVVLLRVYTAPQHLGITARLPDGSMSIVHASSDPALSPPRVIEQRLAYHRLSRFVAFFRFPGVTYG